MSVKKAIFLPVVVLLFFITITLGTSIVTATNAPNETALYFLPLIRGNVQSPYLPVYQCTFDILSAGPRTLGPVVTTMADGQIFISGGQEIINQQKTITTQSHIFNPQDRQFEDVGFSDLAHHSNGIILPDDRVIMFAGGSLNQGSTIQLPEIYDPLTASFSNGGENVICFDAPYAFPDGDVLLICTYDDSNIEPFAQIYDPQLDEVQTFEAATFGSFTGPYPLAFSLPYGDGNVLVTDSYSAAAFDKKSSTNIPIDGLVADGELICGHPNAAIGLSADKSYVFESGGYDDFNFFPGEFYDDACVLDLVKFKKKQLPPMHNARYGHRWIGLPGGDMVVIGGELKAGVTGSIELYTPQTNTWHFAGELNIPRTRFEAVLLNSGEILILGGLAGGSSEVPPPEIGRCQRRS